MVLLTPVQIIFADLTRGQFFESLLEVSTDGSGKASFAKALTKVTLGKTVTATATRVGGDTSEASSIPDALPPSREVATPVGSLRVR
jgi:hypothetical protein